MYLVKNTTTTTTAAATTTTTVTTKLNVIWTYVCLFVTLNIRVLDAQCFAIKVIPFYIFLLGFVHT